MSDIPVQVRGVDIFKLPLSTTEGFILSRVDGASTVDDISMMCGIDVLQVKSILQRLVHLGAVQWGGAKPLPPKAGTATSAERITVRPPAAPIAERNAARRTAPPPPRIEPLPRAPAPVVTTSSAQRPVRATTPKTPVAPSRNMDARSLGQPKVPSDSVESDFDSQRPTVAPPVSDPAQLLDHAELSEDVQIEMERRRSILKAYYRVSDQTFYECLGLDQDADKAEIKRAYFELSKQFHPDSLFGRRLGTYKHKMEVVFKRLTEAYDVLSKKKRREEYDEYLAATAETRRAQDILARANREAAVIEETIRASLKPTAGNATPVEPPSEPPIDHARTNAVLPPPGAPRAEPPAASLRPPPTPRTTVSAEERRRMAQQVLRRRLDAATGRSSSPPPAGSSSVPASVLPSSSAPPEEGGRRQGALRDLARSLRDAHTHTGVDRVMVNVKRGQEAEAARDLVGASNFYRLALAAAPERADLQRDYERVSAALAAQLADSYEKQAQYEERSGRWAEAGAAWVKVCEGRPRDARAMRSAAAALLRANGDLHAALKYAKANVELAGENVGNLTLLGRVYLGAGLKLNARRELEKAAKLDPSDEMIKNLLKEAR